MLVAAVVGMLYKSWRHVGVIAELQLEGGVVSETRLAFAGVITGVPREGPENLSWHVCQLTRFQSKQLKTLTK